VIRYNINKITRDLIFKKIEKKDWFSFDDFLSIDENHSMKHLSCILKFMNKRNPQAFGFLKVFSGLTKLINPILRALNKMNSLNRCVILIPDRSLNKILKQDENIKLKSIKILKISDHQNNFCLILQKLLDFLFWKNKVLLRNSFLDGWQILGITLKHSLLWSMIIFYVSGLCRCRNPLKILNRNFLICFSTHIQNSFKNITWYTISHIYDAVVTVTQQLLNSINISFIHQKLKKEDMMGYSPWEK